MKVCCGGILGLGETINDRIELLRVLANMDPPESVPIYFGGKDPARGRKILTQ